MRDYLKRFLIALIMGLFVSLLFLGGKQIETGMPSSIEYNSKTYILMFASYFTKLNF